MEKYKRLDAAMDSYYNDPNQFGGASSKKTDTDRVARLGALFDKYKGLFSTIATFPYPRSDILYLYTCDYIALVDGVLPDCLLWALDMQIRTGTRSLSTARSSGAMIYRSTPRTLLFLQSRTNLSHHRWGHGRVRVGWTAGVRSGASSAKSTSIYYTHAEFVNYLVIKGKTRLMV